MKKKFKFFEMISEGFFGWCHNAGMWLINHHDTPVVGGVLLWVGDKLEKAHVAHEDKKLDDASEFTAEDGDIVFDDDIIDNPDGVEFEEDEYDPEFEADEPPVEEIPENEKKHKAPHFEKDHSTWLSDRFEDIQEFFEGIGTKIKDFFSGIIEFFKPVNYYEVYGTTVVA